MENIEIISNKIILNMIIMPIVKEENGKKVVYEKDLDKLKLSDGERKLCIEIMKRNNIEFKLVLIDAHDRSPLVKDFNHGKIETEGAEFRDVPRLAKIEYDGEILSFENYDELDEFLEYDFLPNHITYKRKFGDKSKKVYPFLQLNEIVKLKLSEKENKHVMAYLANKGIQVRGIDSSIDGEYENYDYFRTYKNLKNDEAVPLSKNEQIDLFKELRRTNDPSIREKLIISNMRLANWIVYKCNFIETSDDVLQLAYEGLIRAVDHFDPTLGYTFSTYASKTIMHHIMRYYSEVRNSFGGDQSVGWQLSFKRCREIVEKYNNQSITEDESLIEDVVDLMIQEGTISDSSRQFHIDRIKMHFCNISLEENFDELDEMEDNNYDKIATEDIVSEEMLKEKMNEILETLTEREKQVLKLRYGLEDGQCRTQEEVGQIFGVSRGRIWQIEAKALRKLRHPSRSKKIRDYLDEYYNDHNRYKKGF